MQWGSNFSTVTAETLVDYPIAVSQVLTILCAADQTDIRDAEYAAPGTVTDTNFIAVTFALFGSTHAQPYPYYWIMVGIVQQWGDIVDGTNTFTVAFTSFCKIANAGSYSWGGDDNIIRSIELTYFTATYADNSYPFLYIAIGQQQWGYVVGGLNTFTVTFLITYISAFGATASGAAETPTAANTEVSELTNTGFTLRRSSSSNPVYWIAWGVQQWGYEYNVSSKTIEYPIAYSTIAPTVVTSSNGADAKSAVGTITMTSFSAINRAGSQSVWWFSIGIQQWGTFSLGSDRWTYPITFNLIFVALRTTISNNTSGAGYPAWYSWSAEVNNNYAPHINSYQGYAIALGMQQWGLLPVLTTLFNFPIQVEVFLGAHVTYHGRGDYGEPHAYYLGYSEYSNTHITLPAAGNDDETRFISIFGLICSGVLRLQYNLFFQQHFQHY